MYINKDYFANYTLRGNIKRPFLNCNIYIYIYIYIYTWYSPLKDSLK